ncbi:phosphoenolpyruvate carboxylase [Infirmifilum lucidum]|uniref:Phosphoenolpyruvate carboxylase n=1 Tax=Infirmifilum lucidum TaxID=2776706 RepID=A0A7L9FJE3_9CREN|nr:phosphoenolpyruvate carboxylase [Infirmifilum lucidum]QOJ79143.1 phosphoenolpyruvate carboxylase [Infirmifilum lucidum]
MYIPKLMCTQHPDSTVKVSASEEVQEAIDGYRVYGCDEVMVDFEGKLTPYSQPRDIVLRAVEEGLPLGESFFVSVRAPNPLLEGLDRFLLALESAVLANYYSVEHAGVEAVKWVIVPMVDSVDVLRKAQRALREKARLVRELTGVSTDPPELVPLFEGVRDHVNATLILSQYLDYLEEEGATPDRVRVFIGKSDAALRAGHLASMLSTLYALNAMHSFSRARGIDVRIVLGMGSPPFRGGLNNPLLVEAEARLYSGFHTATLQSAVRYDVPRDQALRVARVLREASSSPPRKWLEIDMELLETLARQYKTVVGPILPVINSVADRIPQTRERVRRELYGRVIVGDSPSPAPRAIAFTAACYTLGLPPTLLDADGILAAMRAEHSLPEDILSALRAELDFDFRFFVEEAVARRLGEHVARKALELKSTMGLEASASEEYSRKIAEGEVDALSLASARRFLG